MICPKCGSKNVKVQFVTHVVNKKHGILYWIFVGWWLELIMWIFFTLPWLIFKLLKPKKLISKTEKLAVCQECGKSWKVK